MKANLRGTVSRRSVLLRGVAGLGAATVLAANMTPAMANKLPQKSVSYQPTPKGDRKCSDCSLFEPPNACKTVDGDISPDGWCSIWRKIG
jgi:hypothetical protein